MEFKNATERIKYCKAQKKLERNQQMLDNYRDKTSVYNERKRESRGPTQVKTVLPKTKAKQRQRQTVCDLKANNLKRQLDFRRRRQDNLNRKTTDEVCDTANVFKNRTDKFRAIQKLRTALPDSPTRRSAVIKAYVAQSPTCSHLLRQDDVQEPLSTSVLNDMKEMIEETKMKRSDDARAAMNIVSAFASGDNISAMRAKSKIAQKLGLRRSRVSGGMRIRTTILKSEKASYTNTTRQLRGDALSKDVKQTVYNWWISPDTSTPTGNKRDVKRKRIGVKTYLSHPIYILQKSQTEVYDEFKSQYPDIVISQRAFETLKPYFVQPMRLRDRNTCCCRKHVEIRLVLKKCMHFRRQLLVNKSDEVKQVYPVYSHISELVEATLCRKHANSAFNTRECVERNCKRCGTKLLDLLPEEMDVSDTAPDVEWERYDYVNVQLKNGVKRRKLCVVKKSTKPGYLFKYLTDTLETFPAHQFRATWQQKQLTALKETLPLNQCICIHDFSENYKCSEQNEIQASYYQKTEVSIHVSVIHRHGVKDYDGVDEQNIISELFYVISPDQSHDHHFVHHNQQLIANYSREINCNVDIMHEFTDGCTAQYKSRHCMGSASFACSDFGYQQFVRNYFETSHAKGPQDAAGGLLKRQADLAVMKGDIIQSACDLFSFASDNLSIPKSGIYKRRVFRYIEDIERDESRYFMPIPENRKIHQIISSGNSLITVRAHSCYSCNMCTNGQFSKCENAAQTGKLHDVSITEDKSRTKRVCDGNGLEPETEKLQELVTEGDIVAVFTDDSDEDYYLLKVTTAAESLSQEQHDDWGNNFLRGAEVLVGLYFEKTGSLSYRLIRRKRAIVHAVAACYIIADIRDTAGLLTLPEDMHLDILASVASVLQ
jgi:hypothetical protein